MSKLMRKIGKYRHISSNLVLFILLNVVFLVGHAQDAEIGSNRQLEYRGDALIMPNRYNNLARTNENKIRFQGLATIGASYSPSLPKFGPADLEAEVGRRPMIAIRTDLTLGIRIRDRAFVEIGLGIGDPFGVFDNCNPRWKAYLMPLPIHSIRADVYVYPEHNVHPYATIQCGFANTMGEMTMYLYGYARIGVGVDYKQLTAQLGYSQLYYIKYYTQEDRGCDIIHGLYLEVGYRFNSVKYNKQKRSEKME